MLQLDIFALRNDGVSYLQLPRTSSLGDKIPFSSVPIGKICGISKHILSFFALRNVSWVRFFVFVSFISNLLPVSSERGKLNGKEVINTCYWQYLLKHMQYIYMPIGEIFEFRDLILWLMAKLYNSVEKWR